MTDVAELPALEHCYEVRIGTIGALLGNFLDVSGLSLEYETYTYAEGGRNDFVYQHLGRVKHGNLTLKRGLTEVSVLLDWVLGRPPYDGPQDMVVMFKRADGEVLRSFGFVHAIPVKWTGPNAAIGANAVATESIVVAHRGFTAGNGDV